MTKKNNFLLVDLNEKKTKKLAETITSDTSRKILNYLAEKEHDTETNIAQELKIPISTVHYHLQKLTEASLIIAEEFHYSKKGREINHYKLANKYIIIAPRKVSGLRQALKNVLPVGIIALGISAVIKIMSSFTSRTGSFAAESLQKTAPMLEQAVMMDAAPLAQEIGGNCLPQITTSQPDI
ncbi:helix-turn-helix domain-containing protein, partial [Candidatus Woesearchaeota archaeon]|nr:helix-turn-helix domain-containing protein [Candidatus Woesearchaeota archaeon]